ncbi:UNVERIFIED_CONTAM: hypothetical protein FKN15_055042 [Acipenser sinensis]
MQGNLERKTVRIDLAGGPLWLSENLPGIGRWEVSITCPQRETIPEDMLSFGRGEDGLAPRGRPLQRSCCVLEEGRMDLLPEGDRCRGRAAFWKRGGWTCSQRETVAEVVLRFGRGEDGLAPRGRPLQRSCCVLEEGRMDLLPEGDRCRGRAAFWKRGGWTCSQRETVAEVVLRFGRGEDGLAPRGRPLQRSCCVLEEGRMDLLPEGDRCRGRAAFWKRGGWTCSQRETVAEVVLRFGRGEDGLAPRGRPLQRSCCVLEEGRMDLLPEGDRCRGRAAFWKRGGWTCSQRETVAEVVLRFGRGEDGLAPRGRPLQRSCCVLEEGRMDLLPEGDRCRGRAAFWKRGGWTCSQRETVAEVALRFGRGEDGLAPRGRPLQRWRCVL